MNKFFSLLLVSALIFQAKADNQDLAKLVGVPLAARVVAGATENKFLDKLASGALNASVQRKFAKFDSVTDYAIDTVLHTALLAVEDTSLKNIKQNVVLKPVLEHAMLKSFAYCTAVSFIRAYASSYFGSRVCNTPVTPTAGAGATGTGK